MSVKDTAWPNGAPFAVCPTHDVDRIHKYAYHYLYYGLTEGMRGLRKQLATLKARLAGREPFWNFERIMELEDRLGVRSTFLFLNESAQGFGPKFWGRYDINTPQVKHIIRELDNGGWEIGLHGSYYSYTDRSLLAKEKAILEYTIGKAVRSTRQHYLNLIPRRTWQLQRAVGLEVDSTVGYSDRPWNDADGMLPYYPDNSGILELPITVMDTVDLDNALVRTSVEKLIGRISAAGGLVVLDWHQSAFNPAEYPDRVQVYTSILHNAKAQGAWIATMGEIADHWNSRGDDGDSQ